MILKQTVDFDTLADLRALPDALLEISADDEIVDGLVRDRIGFVLYVLPIALRSANAFQAATDLAACARALARIENRLPAAYVPAVLEAVGTLRAAESCVARLLSANLDRAVSS